MAVGRGGRIEMYNWEGGLLWHFDYHTDEYHQHHDIEYLPNGNILILAWEKHEDLEAIAMGRDPDKVGTTGVWAERIVEVEPTGTNSGNIVWEWHVWDHLIQDFDSTKPNFGIIADHPELININYAADGGGGPFGGQADWIHANSIDYNAELDQILISCRHWDEIWVIDHSTTSAEAAGHTGGQSGKGGDLLYRWGNPEAYDRGTSADRKLFGQHQAEWIPANYPDVGKISVFNNGLGRPAGDYSSVDIIAPPVDTNGNYALSANAAYGPDDLFWTYTASPLYSFFSSNISGAHRLPNGNTMVCEGDDGRLFEVDSTGNIVWEYISPVKGGGPIIQGQSSGGNAVFRTYRYGIDYPAFDGKDLTPGEPVETNPLPLNCLDSTSATYENFLPDIQLLSNLVRDNIIIENNTSKLLQLDIFDMNGKCLTSFSSSETMIHRSVSEWGVRNIHTSHT